MKKKLLLGLLFVFAVIGIMTQSEPTQDEIVVQDLEQFMWFDGGISPMDFDDDDFPEYWLYYN